MGSFCTKSRASSLLEKGVKKHGALGQGLPWKRVGILGGALDKYIGIRKHSLDIFTCMLSVLTLQGRANDLGLRAQCFGGEVAG